MYIDMDSKSIIVPKGKYFTKDGKRIEDKYLFKYNATMLGKKWNIWPCKEVNKKQEKYWLKTKIKYKKMDDDTYELIYTWKQKYTLIELKQQKIEEMEDLYFAFYTHWRQVKDAKTFLEGENAEGQFIKNAYDIDKAFIMEVNKYQDLIDYRIMGSINQGVIL